MTRRLSPQIRNDPTRTLRLIEKNERAATRLVRAYYADVVGVVREEIRMHTGVELDILDGMLRRTDDLARLLGEDLAELAESGTWDGYAAGHRFGSVALGAEIGERQGAWRKIGVLVESYQGEFAGMTADMSKDVRRVISDGMLNERSQGQMIAEIMARSDASVQRAETIVRTEIMRATNAGVTDRYVEAGVDVVEWVTCGDSRACSRCIDLDGRRFPIEDAPPRPLHPRCRCTVVPVIAAPGKGAPKTESWEDMQRGGEKPRVITGKTALREIEMVTADVERELARTAAAYEAKRQEFEAMTRELYKMQDAIVALPRGPERDRLVGELEAYVSERYTPLSKRLGALRAREHELRTESRRIIHERVLFEPEPDARLGWEIVGSAMPSGSMEAQTDAAFDWLRRVVRCGSLPEVGIRPAARGTRASYNFASGVMNVATDSDAATIIHEFGHHIEYTGHRVMREAVGFYKIRTDGEAPRRLSKVLKGSAYRADEVTKVDKFIDPYMGKFYGNGDDIYCTELVSMGIEMLYRDPVRLAREDPEYFEWIVNIVKGVEITW